MIIPEFWKGDLPDVEEVAASVKKGAARVGCKSAGGRNVYVMEYGTPNDYRRTANYSSAIGARDIKYYADKTHPDARPCVYLIGCVHGGEFEGTAAILNLIQLLETGRDFAGNENKALCDWAQKAHLILIPCANPDGRARVPVKSVLGMDYETFRHYDQGNWLDGSLCDWPEVKRVHPISGHVQYLGGYFNDDGINLMHDNFFHPLAEETKLIMDLAAEYAPDFVINFHGATAYDPSFIEPAAFEPYFMREDVRRFEGLVKAACDAEGIPFFIPERDLDVRLSTYAAFNLTAAIHLACGGISLTHESQQGVVGLPPEILSTIGCNEWDVGHEDIYREHMIVFETVKRFTEDMCEKRKKPKPA